MKRTKIKQTSIEKDMTFEEALTQMIRKEPEVTLIGEIRDQKEIESAVLAAQTGNMVITTINSPSPEKIVVGEARKGREKASSVIERLRNQKQGTALEKINDLRKSRENRLKNLSGRKSKRT